MAVYQWWTWVVQVSISPYPLRRESFGIRGVGFRISWRAGCSFCHLTKSVKALKETKSTDPNEWKSRIGLHFIWCFPSDLFKDFCRFTNLCVRTCIILSSWINGFLTDGALLPLPHYTASQMLYLKWSLLGPYKWYSVLTTN